MTHLSSTQSSYKFCAGDIQHRIREARDLRVRALQTAEDLSNSISRESAQADRNSQQLQRTLQDLRGRHEEAKRRASEATEFANVALSRAITAESLLCAAEDQHTRDRRTIQDLTERLAEADRRANAASQYANGAESRANNAEARERHAEEARDRCVRESQRRRDECHSYRLQVDHLRRESDAGVLRLTRVEQLQQGLRRSCDSRDIAAGAGLGIAATLCAAAIIAALKGAQPATISTPFPRLNFQLPLAHFDGTPTLQYNLSAVPATIPATILTSHVQDPEFNTLQTSNEPTDAAQGITVTPTDLVASSRLSSTTTQFEQDEDDEAVDAAVWMPDRCEVSRLHATITNSTVVRI